MAQKKPSELSTLFRQPFGGGEFPDRRPKPFTPRLTSYSSMRFVSLLRLSSVSFLVCTWQPFSHPLLTDRRRAQGLASHQTDRDSVLAYRKMFGQHTPATVGIRAMDRRCIQHTTPCHTTKSNQTTPTHPPPTPPHPTPSNHPLTHPPTHLPIHMHHHHHHHHHHHTHTHTHAKQCARVATIAPRHLLHGPPHL